MDFLYGHDRNFGDFDDAETTDILEPDIADMITTSSMMEDSFLPSLTESDNDWFINSIFGEQDLVYNDKNLGEAATQPCIKSEHSYSTNNLSPVSPVTLAKDEMDISVFQSQGTSLDLHQSSQLIQAASSAMQPHTMKVTSPTADPLLTAMTSSETTTSSLAHPATIILTTATSSSQPVFSPSTQAVFPNATTLTIKTEPMDGLEALQEQTVNVESLILPPTPPSSNGSDSDGSQSPQRSAPNSPERQSPMPQSGVLILSEEEKRTLISEGYPVPAKLPLTKQEEKNLKKVRRKIKNKISAQESRRKKKEYLEALEKRVEAFNHENSDLKKKVESLENNNRSLLGQLHKLQAMIAKVPKTAAASATQTGTVLMVLVLCFAMFLGGGGVGPSSLNVGYGNKVSQARLGFQQPAPLRPQPNMGPGPARAADTSDDYTTPNLKSRVLMAFSKEEADEWCDEYRPLVPWEREVSCPTHKDSAPPTQDKTGLADPGVEGVMPVVPQPPVKRDSQQGTVVTISLAADNTTRRANEHHHPDQATMHPDIAVAPALGGGNLSADLETA